MEVLPRKERSLRGGDEMGLNFLTHTVSPSVRPTIMEREVSHTRPQILESLVEYGGSSSLLGYTRQIPGPGLW